MSEQGSSTLKPAPSGRILDRLVGLEKVVSRELMREVLAETGKVNGRKCILSHEVMLWIVLAMGLLTNMPIRQVFRHARRFREDESRPARSSLSVGRKRLGVEPLKVLHAKVVRPLATSETPGAFYKGMRLMGIDATVLDVPDSEANQSFGRPSGGRGEGAFPQVRKTSLVELGTHVEVAFAFGGLNQGEQTQAEQLYDLMPDDTLLLQDRGFFSFETWMRLHLRYKLLVRVKSNMILKPIEQLADGSYLAKVYRSAYDRDKDRNGIVVRVIKYVLDDTQRTGHQEVHRLLTNLLDADLYPALELIPLYHERWEEETVFDEQKTHQDPRRAEKAAHLRSETPEGVAQELYALSLGHFSVRAMMLDAANNVGLDVDRLSFKGCFQILQCRLPECDASSGESIDAWYRGLLHEMLEEQIGPRRNRINPRVIKRKMSKWKKAQPHHRKQPPLTKTFEESIVVTM